VLNYYLLLVVVLIVVDYEKQSIGNNIDYLIKYSSLTNESLLLSDDIAGRR
jgi:hypothetical protein